MSGEGDVTEEVCKLISVPVHDLVHKFAMSSELVHCIYRYSCLVTWMATQIISTGGDSSSFSFVT